MGETGVYLCSASVSLALMYGLYIAFFRRTTFFALNRYYLLSCLAFSFVIPVLNVSWPYQEYDVFLPDRLNTTFFSSGVDLLGSEPTALPGQVTDGISALFIVYCMGAMFMLSRIGSSMYHIVKVKRSARRSFFGSTLIFRSALPHPFSFFNLIFIPEHHVSPVIVEHERVHVRQWHSIDLLLVELATVVLWFNPIMYFFKRSLKTQHEYLADDGAIRRGILVQDYLKVLLDQIQTENAIRTASQFYSKSIKNRIIMITKNKTSPRFSGMYLLLIPVVCLLLFAFSDQRDKLAFANPAPGSDNEITIIIDPGHGGSDAGAGSGIGVSEKALTLAIARKVQAVGNNKGMRVILTRTDDRNPDLETRASFSQKFPARVFISLHINSHDTDASKSGIECFISEGNAEFEQSQVFANYLVDELKTIGKIPVAGILKSNFIILRNNSIPAVVLELGYLSNKEDLNFLREEKNQRLLAEKIVNAAGKHL